jgi:hypothetical protein
MSAYIANPLLYEFFWETFGNATVYEAHIVLQLFLTIFTDQTITSLKPWSKDISGVDYYTRIVPR